MMTDTMGGTTEVVLNGMLATWPHVQSGKLKAIANRNVPGRLACLNLPGSQRRAETLGVSLS
jgi:hypothetical protein